MNGARLRMSVDNDRRALKVTGEPRKTFLAGINDGRSRQMVMQL
jgi:hypothetical protein